LSHFPSRRRFSYLLFLLQLQLLHWQLLPPAHRADRMHYNADGLSPVKHKLETLQIAHRD
jgi:hypothetical protein